MQQGHKAFEKSGQSAGKGSEDPRKQSKPIEREWTPLVVVVVVVVVVVGVAAAVVAAVSSSLAVAVVVVTSITSSNPSI